jgi:hypothetical protein
MRVNPSRCRAALVAGLIVIVAICGAAAVSSGEVVAAKAPAAPHPAWPTLAQQLAQQRVLPGTALERLILDNQDFGVLRPGEAGDALGIPPWLRVWWRKQHPQGGYAAADPTGGYPHLLRDLYEWMLGHQDLQRGGVQGSTGASTRDANASGEQRISGAQSASRGETAIRVNRWQPRQIVAASKNLPPGALPGYSGAQMAIFYSSDGGVSWGQSYLPWLANDIFMGDPAVDWTSDGTAWATIIGVDLNLHLYVRAYKSTDGGATWSFDATLPSPSPINDKEMMWVDHGAASPFKDNIYVIWDIPGGPVLVARRNGPNGTWQAPILVGVWKIGTDVKTNQYGDVFAFLPGVTVLKSTDGGASFGAPVMIATTFGTFWIGVPANNGRRVLVYPVGGAYRTAVRNDVYVAWADLSGEPGCATGSDAPGSNAASPCKTRIFFSRSADGGSTWSARVKINDPAGLDDQFSPWLVVDDATGRISVSYYDTAGDVTRASVNVYYQSSTDGGQTWTAPFKVTTAATDEAAAGASWFQFGDYSGMDGYAGTFFPAWTDRRSGGPEEIWTAGVLDSSSTCTPPAAPAGLAAVPNGPTGINLAWGASPGAVQYSVLRSTTSGGPYAPASTAASTSLADVGLACNATYYYRVAAGNAYCFSGGGGEVSASTARCAASLGFYTVPPCRVFDTRGGAPLASGAARLFRVAGSCGIPADARAVAANWTIVQPQGPGALSIYPGDAQLPVATTLDFSSGQVRANSAVVLLAGDGSGGVNAFAALAGGGTTDLILDVSGYFK